MTDETTVDALVELGRQVDNCERHGSTWCSCKVRQYLNLMAHVVAIIPLDALPASTPEGETGLKKET